MRFRHLIWIHLFFITLYGESKKTESINNQYNLKKYDAIIPCGIKNKGITNLKEIKDKSVSLRDGDEVAFLPPVTGG